MNIPARLVFKILSITLVFILAVLVAYLVRQELIWIGTALFLAIALNPLVEYLTRFAPRRSRGLAAGTVFLSVVLLFSFLLVALVPPLIKQSGQLVRNFPQYTDQLVNGSSLLSEKIREYNLVDRIRQSQDQTLSYVSSASGPFLSILKGVFSSFAAGVTILVLTFFMLLEGPRWIGAFWDVMPPKRRARVRPLLAQMYDAVTGYVTGNVLTSLLAATLTAAMLAIVGVPYAIPLGIVVGLFDFLPLVGATIGATLAIVAALFTSVGAGIAMVIFFFIYQQLENHVLQPLVYGRTVSMSPLLVMVSVLIGAGLGGIIGAIVAIPVGASLQILVRDLAARRIVRS